MSDINYSIYGTPDTWRIWSDTPTSDVVWGACRIGASNFSDADFINYPATKTGYYDSFYALYNNGKIAINEAVDNSVAYTAINNSDLPQMNVGIFSPTHYSINDPLAVVDNSKPLPFAFGYYNDINGAYNPCIRQTIQGFDGFPNNAAVFGAQALQRWAPFGACQNTTQATTGYYNPSGYIFPILSWGIKSVFFELRVRYRKTNNDMEIRSLSSYLSLGDDDWKHNNPICGAWLEPYYRINVNGTYSSSHAYQVTYKDRVNGINPIFYAPYKCAGYDVYNYTGNYARNAGCLPIWGICITDGNYSDDRLYSQTYNNPSQTTIGSYAKVFGYNKGNITFTPTTNYLTIRPKLDLSIAENVEYILKGAAAYGVFFCLDIGTLAQAGRDTGSTERWIDSNMYLGIIRADGMTYGDYTKGSANADQVQYGWKDSTETPYVPGQNTNIYSQQTRIRAIGHIDTMTKRYVLDSNAVKAMAVDMFDIMSDLSEQGTNWTELQAKSVDAFLVQNPIDCIVSLKKYPVKNIPKDNTLVNIQYGRYTSGSAAAYECLADVYTYAFTPKEIQPRFGRSFLDYEPYTSAELFIPYCGTVQLRMCDILGKTLQPFICVDYYTGQCTGFIMCDGIVIETIQGTIAVDVPVTGIQTATIEGQLQNAANVARQARVNQAAHYMKAGLIVGAATLASPALGAMALATQIKGTLDKQLQKNQADYELTHTEAPQHIIGASSSACSWIIDSDTARLILYYPGGGVIDDDLPPNFDADALAEFIRLNGVATVETGKIGSYPGITSGCKPMLTSITTANGTPATDAELKLIEDAIFEGLIVPNS